MITPIEIRQHTFKKALRGYDKEEVNNFLNTLSMEWERFVEEHKRTKIELEKTQSNLENLRQVESALHKTLLQAEETSRSTMENAKKDAELKVAEAESKSKSIVKQAMEDRSRIEMQIDELVHRRNEILQQLKSYLQAQTERLRTFEEKEMKGAALPEYTQRALRVEEAPKEDIVLEEEPAVLAKEEKVEEIAGSESEENSSFFEDSVGGDPGADIADEFADEL